MHTKYSIEYAVPFTHHSPPLHHRTDDPVACEEFLAELIERRFKICSIRHEGTELPQPAFDQMLRSAAGMVSARHLCAALGIDSSEAHRRFGTPA